MSGRLATTLTQMERQYERLRREFCADGHVSAAERAVLDDVQAKLSILRKEVARAARTELGAVDAGAAEGRPAAASSARRREADGGEVELTLGPASIQRLALGPAVAGPRIGDLWALLAEDGSPLNRSNSKVGAHLNERGSAALATFRELQRSRHGWLALYDEVAKMAELSAAGLRKMKESAAAVGERSKNRRGAYVREHSEAYIKGQREVEDRLRAIGPRQEALNKALSEVNEAGLGKRVTDQERLVDDAEEEVEKEKKRIEERKARLKGLFELGIKAVRADWVGLAEDAAKLVGGELIDALPTERLDQLKKRLERATDDLERIEDELLLAKLETASAGLRGAAKALDDGRRDVLDAMADLRLAQKTAIEALGESRSTAAAGKMIALRGKMLLLMERARGAVSRYLRESAPYVKELHDLAGLYKSYPGVLKMTPGLDVGGAYAKNLAATALEDERAVSSWRSYVEDHRKAGRSALRRLADTGEGSFLQHFDQVPKVLEAAIRDR